MGAFQRRVFDIAREHTQDANKSDDTNAVISQHIGFVHGEQST
jgi:hypothetical protein